MRNLARVEADGSDRCSWEWRWITGVDRTAGPDRGPPVNRGSRKAAAGTSGRNLARRTPRNRHCGAVVIAEAETVVAIASARRFDGHQFAPGEPSAARARLPRVALGTVARVGDTVRRAELGPAGRTVRACRFRLARDADTVLAVGSVGAVRAGCARFALGALRARRSRLSCWVPGELRLLVGAVGK